MKLKNHRFPVQTVIFALELLKTGLTYRAVAEELARRNISVGHKTVWEWAQKFHIHRGRLVS